MQALDQAKPSAVNRQRSAVDAGAGPGKAVVTVGAHAQHRVQGSDVKLAGEQRALLVQRLVLPPAAFP
jgi:hypothetical protein